MLNFLKHKKSNFDVFKEYLNVCYAISGKEDVYYSYAICLQARDQTGLTFKMIDSLVEDIPFRDVYNSLKDESKQNIVKAINGFNEKYRPLLGGIKTTLETAIISNDLLSEFSLLLDLQNVFKLFHPPDNDFHTFDLIDVAWPGLYYRLVPELRFTDIVTAFYLANDTYRDVYLKTVAPSNHKPDSLDVKSLSEDYLLGLPEKVTIDNLVSFSRTKSECIPRVPCSTNKAITEHLLR